MNIYKIRKTDIILIAVILIISAVFVLYGLFISEPTKSVYIFVNNEEIGNYSIVENQKIELDFDGIIGGTVVISDGFVWVENFGCPDKLCEKTGKISRVGEVIICLPNKMIIRIS